MTGTTASSPTGGTPMHAIGNGRLIVYGQGPDIRHVFGPPYTSCDQLAITFEDAGCWHSAREAGSAVWRHERKPASGGSGESAVITDAVHPRLALWARSLRSGPSGLALTVRFPEYAQAAELADERDGDGTRRWTIRIPAGSPLFMYRSGAEAYSIFRASGISGCVREGHVLHLIMSPGESELRLIGGPSYPECRDAESRAAMLSFGEVAAAAAEAAASVLGRIRPELKPDVPDERRRQLTEAAEGVASIIGAHTGEDGGISAGYPFPLAYVRDQYGVSRGLLALGLLDEARRNLVFRFGRFLRFGSLKNAEAIGGADIRHEHENDEVEITAYVILQTLDYIDRTEDEALLREFAPMLEWCMDAQLAHLVDGMLPFNGDETYVAGGFLPRQSLLDGSSEATMLFIEAGRRLLDWDKRCGMLRANRRTLYANKVREASGRFAGHFIRGGRLLTNQPGRAAAIAAPRYRHGVCMTCDPSSPTYFGWTERSGRLNYVCPMCRAAGEGRDRISTPVVLPSTALLPSFIGSGLLPEALLRHEAERLLPSWTACFEGDGGSAPIRLVGYDVGLLLLTLAKLRHPALDRFGELVLSASDETCAWPERYIGRLHDGCRARPWESAVNLTALIDAANAEAARKAGQP